MSLDFAMLAEDGRPANSIALPPSLHHELIATATEFGLTQLLRFDEYYDDVEVAPADLRALRLDVSTLQQRLPPGALRTFLTSLSDLIASAAANHAALHAISD
jgi:hypothetical protein